MAESEFSGFKVLPAMLTLFVLAHEGSYELELLIAHTTFRFELFSCLLHQIICVVVAA